MLVSELSAAFTAAIVVLPRARTQTETRLPGAGIGALPAQAQGHPLFVISTGARMATSLREPAGSVVVIPNEMLRAQSALRLDDAIRCASSFSMSEFSSLPALRAALFVNS